MYDALDTTKRVHFDANNLSSGPFVQDTLKSGEMINQSGNIVSPSNRLTTQEGNELNITETNVQRKKLNLQFGELTGIPSALGMTSGDNSKGSDRQRGSPHESDDLPDNDEDSGSNYEDDVDQMMYNPHETGDDSVPRK